LYTPSDLTQALLARASLGLFYAPEIAFDGSPKKCRNLYQFATNLIKQSEIDRIKISHLPKMASKFPFGDALNITLRKTIMRSLISFIATGSLGLAFAASALAVPVTLLLLRMGILGLVATRRRTVWFSH